MKTLILGDIHISNKDAGLRGAQEKCIKKIYNKVKPDEVIQLGDFLDFRKPSPEALLTAKSIIDHWKKKSKVVILRGNHCASTKADDGVTALSVFESSNVHIVTHTFIDKLNKRVYIPHYENEEKITEILGTCDSSYTVFGHFGYFGCLNSVGDYDFNININSFRSNCILGHIHRQNERTFMSDGEEKSVLILGTPYTTNFGESEKTNFYAVIDEKKGRSLHRVNHGPRHLVIKNKDVQGKVAHINDKKYHTLLRVVLDAGETQVTLEDIHVASVDVKYSAAFDEEELSNYAPSRELFRLNDVVIEDYIESANSSIEKSKLLEGYNLLKYED